MTHLVLARKYRPKQFSHVVGQDAVVATLKAAIVKNRVAHALLFTGGRGTGKTTVARLVAKALVCLNLKDAEPCNSCPQCVAIDNFSSLDVIEIDGASHTGVDDVRELRDSSRFMPTSAKYKIFIIDEVHMLSTSAFNALLKILEEPPAHVMFIFATTEAHKIPKTILSRCQRYDFKRVAKETIMHALKAISVHEGFSIADDGLLLIASLADGGMRDALSMTEQIISNASAHFMLEDVTSILGIVSHQAVKDVAEHIIYGKTADALLVIKDVYEKGFDVCQMMDALAERLRILALCAHVEERRVFSILPSLAKEDFVFANNQDKADLKRLFAMALEGVHQVFQAEKPLLSIELFILRAATRPAMADAVTINYCLNKLDAIMHNRPLPKDLSPLKKEQPAAIIAQAQHNPPPVLKNPDATSMFAQALLLVAKDQPGLASHLRLGRPSLDAAQKVITVYFEHSLHYEEVEKNRSNKVLGQALAVVFGPGYSLALSLTKKDVNNKSLKTVAEADQEQKVLAQKQLKDRVLTDPVVEKALKIFGGDITEVSPVLPAK